jgi:hypothetical protein
MIDKWDMAYKAGEEVTVPVIIINDTYNDFNDTLKLVIIRDEEILEEKSAFINVEKLGLTRQEFTIGLPVEKGNYRMEARLIFKDEPVRSGREFMVEL